MSDLALYDRCVFIVGRTNKSDSPASCCLIRVSEFVGALYQPLWRSYSWDIIKDSTHPGRFVRRRNKYFFAKYDRNVPEQKEALGQKRLVIVLCGKSDLENPQKHTASLRLKSKQIR